MTSVAGFAQSFNLKNFSSDQGLPYFQVFDIMQDSRGFIWFATDKGVSRYNGYEFQNFDIEDGLPENTIVEIYEDSKGRIWFASLICKLAVFENEKITLFRFNDKIIDVIPQKAEPSKKGIYVDAQDNVYMGIKEFGYLKVFNNSGSVEVVNDQKNENNFFFDQYADRLFYTFPKTLKRNGIVKFIDVKNLNYSFNINPVELISTYPVYYINGDDIFYSALGDLFHFNLRNGAVRKKSFNSRIISINGGKSDELWIGLQNEGVEIINIKDFSRVKKLLENYSVSDVCWDYEGGTWISTLENGIYYILKTEITSLSENDGLYNNNVTQILKDDKNNLILGYNSPVVNVINTKGVKTVVLPGSKGAGVESVEYSNADNAVYISTKKGFYKYKDDHLQTIDVPFKENIRANDFFINDQNEILIAGIGFSLIKYNEQGQRSVKQIDYNYHFSEIEQDKGGSVWLAGNRGVWKYYKGIFVSYGMIYPELSNRVTALETFPEKNMLIIGTNGYGLYVYFNNELYNLTIEDGLTSNNITSIFAAEDKIWIGTNQGLNSIREVGEFSVEFEVKAYTKNDGLISNIINDVYVDENKVYIATNKGVNVFSPSHLTENEIPPRLYFSSIQINNQDTIFQPEYKLKYNENNLNLEYVGLSYKNAGTISYRYRLEGLDSTWYTTRSRGIRYSSLPSGDFTFKVFARNSSGYENKYPLQIKFKVLKPFWETWMFVLIISVFFVGIVLTFILLIRKSYQRRINLLKYRQQVLRQQMNPHFIFNTLNSIQLYILEKDTEMSQRYLGKFSRLMRVSLEHAQYQAVSVRDEVNSLNLYLELEMLRFDGQITYDVELENEDELLNLNIPSLIIQPFVENSIWHGLTHKEGGGHIQISLHSVDEYVLCVVEDDGIGRKKAMEISNTKMKYHKSYGISITSKRISLLNELSKNNLDIKYLDLEDETGNAKGTRVEIKIPVVASFKSKVNW